MKCEEVQKLIHPFIDGELGVVASVQIEEHLSGCSECASQEKQLQALKIAISSSSLYYRAPEGLRTQLQRSTHVLGRDERRQFPRLPAIAAGILLLVAASATAVVLWSRTRTTEHDRVAELVVAAHVRSLQASHATDVASTDQHTVKPWFQGKLDFSPPVPDLTANGYSLIGGRLDYLVDRPVAALVYRFKLHPINVFIWQATNHDDAALQQLSRQGFHIRFWQKVGMTYWAISDLADRELDEFVELFQQQSSVSSR